MNLSSLNERINWLVRAAVFSNTCAAGPWRVIYDGLQATRAWVQVYGVPFSTFSYAEVHRWIQEEVNRGEG